MTQGVDGRHASQVAADTPGPADTPPDATVLVASLAAALAALHDGNHGDIDLARVRALDPVTALGEVSRAVEAGWTPPPGSPYERSAPLRLLEVLGDGMTRATARPVDPVLTIGRATFANLVLVDAAGPSTSPPGFGVAANITFRRRTAQAPGPRFLRADLAAWSDPYRDLAVAAAEVVEVLGAGAVPSLVDGYVSVRPGIEPLDLVRLDWWSMVASVLAPGRPPPGGGRRGSPRPATHAP